MWQIFPLWRILLQRLPALTPRSPWWTNKKHFKPSTWCVKLFKQTFWINLQFFSLFLVIFSQKRVIWNRFLFFFHLQGRCFWKVSKESIGDFWVWWTARLATSSLVLCGCQLCLSKPFILLALKNAPPPWPSELKSTLTTLFFGFLSMILVKSNMTPRKKSPNKNLPGKYDQN